MLFRSAVTDSKITGPITGAKLGPHPHAGADITSGTVVDARLSANVALLSTAQTFTGAKTFIDLRVPSPVLVPNLNADLLDGQHATDIISTSSTSCTSAIDSLQVQLAEIKGMLTNLLSSSAFIFHWVTPQLIETNKVRDA